MKHLEYTQQAIDELAKPGVRAMLLEVAYALKDIEPFDQTAIGEVLNRIGMKRIQKSLRAAIMGRMDGLPIDACVWILGRDRTLDRIIHAGQYTTGETP